MRAKPDLVFVQPESKRLLIVELKTHTKRETPSDGWANLRAQLWAYAHIDDFRAAPALDLAAEVWHYWKEHSFYTCVRRYRWNVHDMQFAQPCEELFDLYKAGCEALP